MFSSRLKFSLGRAIGNEPEFSTKVKFVVAVGAVMHGFRGRLAPRGVGCVHPVQNGSLPATCSFRKNWRSKRVGRWGTARSKVLSVHNGHKNGNQRQW